MLYNLPRPAFAACVDSVVDLKWCKIPLLGETSPDQTIRAIFDVSEVRFAFESISIELQLEIRITIDAALYFRVSFIPGIKLAGRVFWLASLATSNGTQPEPGRRGQGGTASHGNRNRGDHRYSGAETAGRGEIGFLFRGVFN